MTSLSNFADLNRKAFARNACLKFPAFDLFKKLYTFTQLEVL
jgi:hypothetical protein